MTIRERCVSCKHVFGGNEAKVTYDHVKFYCCSCDDEKKRVAEIETALARNDLLERIDKYESSVKYHP